MNEPIRMLIVDNGSDNFDEISDIASLFADVTIRNLGFNFGLAHAQNVGLNYAIDNHFEFALLLDQDSLPQIGFVMRSIQAFKLTDPQGLVVAAVAPRFFDAATGYIYPFVRFDSFSVVVFEPTKPLEDISLMISSGSMLRVRLLLKIGLMNESFFIDHIDTEWCLRAKFAGFSLIGVSDNVMRHSVGDSTIRVFGRHLPAHNPERRYLSTRNLYYLIFHTRAPFPWKLKEFFSSFLKLAVSLWKCNNRMAHIRSFLLGAFDGIDNNFSRKK